MPADASLQSLALLLLALVLAGGLSGLLAGLFGIGGGTIIVPMLIEALTLIGVNPVVVTHLAIGSSLAIIAPTALRSYHAHRARGAPDQALLRAWLLPVPLGVIAASVVVGALSGSTLRLIFAGVAALMALKMLFNRDSWRFGSDLPGEPWRGIVGFTIGVVAALMGIGGGNFNNVFMTSFGRSIHQAVATSSGLGLLIALPGLAGYIWAGWGHPDLPIGSLGFVNLFAVAIVAPLALVMAPLGARLAHGLSKRQLEIVFGLFLLAIAARFAWSAMG